MTNEIFRLPSFLGKIVQFFSNNFELILYLNLSMVLGFLAVYIALKFKERTGLLRKVRAGFDFSLYALAAIVELGLVSLFVYTAWENYNSPETRFDLTKLLLPSTHWIKKDLTLFYIEDNTLNSIKIDGSDQSTVLTANEPIKGYHFSPNGRYILINTNKTLNLWDKDTGTSSVVDSLAQDDPAKDINGVIGGIRWSPDSQRFCYEESQWSKYMTQDQFFVYAVSNQTRQVIPMSLQKLSSLYWDKTGENLYNLRYMAQDTSTSGYPYDVLVTRIPLTTLKGETVAKIPHKDTTVPENSLLLRNISLFTEGDKLSFVQSAEGSKSFSNQEPGIGIDKDDFLYVVYKGWFHKRLLKIPKQVPYGDWPRHIFQAERLIGQIRWLPGAKYLIMEHKQMGTLILEARTRRVGLLIEARGNTFGWYENVLK